MYKIVYPAPLLFIFLFLWSLTSPIIIHAASFIDDFNTYDISKWSSVVDTSESTLIIPDNTLLLSGINSQSFPYLTKNIQDQDFILEIKFKFSGNPNYGAGVILTDNLIPYGLSTGIQWSNIVFNVWAKPNQGFAISSVICPENDATCVHDNYNKTIFEGNSNTWYVLKITSVNDAYELSIDNIDLLQTEKTTKRLKYLSFGSPEHTGGVIWPSFLADYIKLNINLENTDKTPVVIVPGFGTSWDFPALLIGTSGTDWKIPNFVTVYDSLIKSIENNGYKKDKDLFVFSYDWRKPIDTLADELNAFLIGHTKNGQKVSIIGHSMGGLFSRIYLQKFGTDKVNQLITLGSPHKGALEAYSLWEGAKLWSDIWWGKVGVETIVQLNQKPFENRVDTLRFQVPSIKDLLPVYDYLSFNGIDKKWNDLTQKNQYLFDKNTNILSLQTFVSAFAGNNEDTKTKVKTTKRSAFETLLGMWEDGKPIANNPFILTKGDGTVSMDSALLSFSTTELFNTNHVGLPGDRNVIEKIFDKLSLDKSKIEILPQESKSNVFTAILRSPGRLEVCNENGSLCDDKLGIYEGQSKLFMYPGYSDQKLRVRVYAQGTGDYKLHLGNIQNDAHWNVISGNINQTNQIDTYMVTNNSEVVSVEPDNTTNQNSLRLCKNKMNNLAKNWDKQNDMNTLLNPRSNDQQRIKSIYLLRLKLGAEIIKTKKSPQSEIIKASLSCWDDLDNVIKNMYLGVKDKNRHYAKLELKDFVEKMLNNTKNIVALDIFNKATDKISEANLLAQDNRKLSNEITLSADGLLLIALGLR